MAVIEANGKNFAQLIDTNYAVVDFYKNHCGGCVFMAPFYHELADDLAFIHFLTVNVDEYPKLGEQYNIQVLPTLLFFRDGKMIFQVEDGQDSEALKRHIARMLYVGE